MNFGEILGLIPVDEHFTVSVNYDSDNNEIMLRITARALMSDRRFGVDIKIKPEDLLELHEGSLMPKAVLHKE